MLLGQDRTGQDRTGQDRTGQDRTGQDRTVCTALMVVSVLSLLAFAIIFLRERYPERIAAHFSPASEAIEEEAIEAYEPSGEVIEANEPSGEVIEANEPSGEAIEANEPSGEVIEAYEPSDASKDITRGWSKSLEGVRAEIVFAGDSITCNGEWNTFFPEASICTISVPGENIDALRYRDFMVLDRAPRKIFLMIGINSMWLEVEDILERYEVLLQDFQSVDQVYVQSILPVRPPEKIDNEKIRLVNEGLRRLAEEYGDVYIDLHSHFVDADGLLKECYSLDGCHINAEGYAVWIELIREYITV